MPTTEFTSGNSNLLHKLTMFTRGLSTMLFWCVVMMGTSAQLFAATILVPQDQPTIQAGINAAVNGDTVLVGAGIFTENLNTNGKNIVLAGTYGPNPTILRAANKEIPIVKFNNGESPSTMLKRFTFTDTTNVSLILVFESSPTIDSCTIINSLLNGTSPAVEVTSGAPRIKRMLIAKCQFFYAIYATPAATNTQLLNITIDGGGLIERGLYAYGDGAIARNNIVTGCSFLSFYTNGNPNVIHGYNDVWNNGNSSMISPPVGAGSISADPIFVNQAIGNYHLQAASPCRNAGHPDPSYNDPDGSRNDIGALPHEPRTPRILQIPSEFATLSDAINFSIHSDTINISSGEFFWSQATIAHDLLIQGMGIDSTRVYSLDSVSTLVLSADVMYRGISFLPDTGATNPFLCPNKRAIIAITSTIVIDSCRFSRLNGVGVGGAISALNSRLSMFHTSLDSNTAYRYDDAFNNRPGCSKGSANGGAIGQEGGTLYLENCSFSFNQAIYDYGVGTNPGEAYGGAIIFSGDSLQIVSSTLANNLPWGNTTSGGAVHASCLFFQMENSTVENNSSSGGHFAGGGVGAEGAGCYVSANEINVSGSTFRNNRLYANRSYFYGLSPVAHGAGFCAYGNSISVDSCTFERNKISVNGFNQYYGTDCSGSGLFTSGNALISRCSFVSNELTQYPDVEGIVDSGIPATPIYLSGAHLFCSGAGSIGNSLFYDSRFHVDSSITNSSHLSLIIEGEDIAGGFLSSSSVLRYPVALILDSLLSNLNPLSENPLVCDTFPGSDLLVRSSSRCVAANNSSGQMIGSRGIGCENVSPTISSIASDTAIEMTLYVSRVQSTDPDGPSISYSYINLPSWLSSNADSVYGTPTLINDDTSFTVIASDGFLSDTQVVALVVLRTTPGADSLNTSEEFANLHVLDHTPQFDWDFLPYDGNAPQTQFEIAVGTDNNWAFAEKWNPAPFSTSDTSIVYDGSTLIDGATYYARLRVNNGIAWSPWFESSFRMNSVPSIPNLATPLNGALTANPPTLSVANATDVENDPLTYDFALFADSALNISVDAASGITQTPTTTSWTPAMLTENTRFYWRSRSYDGFEYSNWSGARSFVTNGIPEAPQAFSLLSPDNSGLPVFDLTPTLNWQTAIDPDPSDTVRYLLEIAINQNFTFDSDIDSILGNSYTMPDSLEFGRHYWWRVTAKDKTGLTTAGSNVLDFWTWELGDVDHSHSTDIGDLTMLVDHLFITFDPIVPTFVGDLNGDCSVDIADLTVLVDHLFISFAPLVPGCE